MHSDRDLGRNRSLMSKGINSRNTEFENSSMIMYLVGVGKSPSCFIGHSTYNATLSDSYSLWNILHIAHEKHFVCFFVVSSIVFEKD